MDEICHQSKTILSAIQVAVEWLQKKHESGRKLVRSCRRSFELVRQCRKKYMEFCKTLVRVDHFYLWQSLFEGILRQIRPERQQEKQTDNRFPFEVEQFGWLWCEIKWTCASTFIRIHRLSCFTPSTSRATPLDASSCLAKEHTRMYYWTRGWDARCWQAIIVLLQEFVVRRCALRDVAYHVCQRRKWTRTV